MAEEKKQLMELTQEEQRLILLLRDMQFGEISVVVKDRALMRADVKHSVPLRAPSAEK